MDVVPQEKLAICCYAISLSSYIIRTLNGSRGVIELCYFCLAMLDEFYVHMMCNLWIEVM